MADKTASPKKDKTTLQESPFIILKGFLMGSADIVPGVSGGTIALIVGIYERLLSAINSVNLNFLKYFFTFKWKKAFDEAHWFFVVCLFAGIFSAFAFFTRVVPLQIYMFTHPEIVYGLFFGLIVGSIYILIKALERFTWHEAIMLVAGIGLGLWVVLLVPTDTPETPAFVFLSGSIAISAMILPGISGSYILLILRKYDYLLTQLSNIGGSETFQAFINILPFVFGAIIGLAVFSRFLSWLLDKYHSQTIAILIGFMIGSLYVIWPFQHREYVEQVRHSESLPVQNERVQELMQNPPAQNLPEYERLAEEIEDEGGLKVVVESVSRKLIHSEPFIPGFIGEREQDDPNIWGGFGGMLVGFMMIGLLEKLREKG